MQIKRILQFKEDNALDIIISDEDYEYLIDNFIEKCDMTCEGYIRYPDFYMIAEQLVLLSDYKKIRYV
jgi:hypothetical protein